MNCEIKDEAPHKSVDGQFRIDRQCDGLERPAVYLELSFIVSAN